MEIVQQMLQALVDGLIKMSTTQPKLVAVFAILYVVGLGFRILREAVEKFVAESPSKDDDIALAKIEASPISKFIFFLVDLLIRLKKPGV